MALVPSSGGPSESTGMDREGNNGPRLLAETKAFIVLESPLSASLFSSSSNLVLAVSFLICSVVTTAAIADCLPSDMGRSSPNELDKSKPGPAQPTCEETPLLQEHASSPDSGKSRSVSWASIPGKWQLAVLVMARLAEPLSERSLTSYLFYQLQWLNPDLDPAEIPKQAGYLTAVFAAAQCLTSVWWGHAADNPSLGRKRVLMIGLVGSAMSALGMAFSTSLYAAFFFRFCAGALNGNIGVLRTMVSEIVVDKRCVKFPPGASF